MKMGRKNSWDGRTINCSTRKREKLKEIRIELRK
jgi:hypothetical protein